MREKIKSGVETWERKSEGRCVGRREVGGDGGLREK